MKIEYKDYVTMLRSSGIKLNNTSDNIVWSWNIAMGDIIANLVYHSITFFNNE
jgi:hypothetical protein